jgi:hypothetical protein
MAIREPMGGAEVTMLAPPLREHVFFVGSEDRKSADLVEKSRKARIVSDDRSTYRGIHRLLHPSLIQVCFASSARDAFLFRNQVAGANSSIGLQI